MKNNLSRIWNEAATKLNLSIEFDFVLTLPSGNTIPTDLLVKDFGAEKGMLIVHDYNVVCEWVNEISELGYGFSVMDLPLDDEEFSEEDFISLLSDWGLSKESKNKYTWIKN